MRKFIPGLKSYPTVSVVRMSGVISPSGRFDGGALNDVGLAPLLEKAFKKGKPKAVALLINSPGGSPVQSSLIGARIRRLAEETDVKTYAFCEDVAASGGYWLACAADEIYVDSSSIVGSIGVISASFGFAGLMKKQGIERRVHTAGTDKSMLDPFREERAEDVERLKDLQRVIHQNFKDHVEGRRGNRLADRDLFTGEVWVGPKAVQDGLADCIGHLIPFMQKKFGDKVQFNVLGQKRSFLSRFGVQAAVGSAIASVEDQALWAQYGVN